MPKITGTSTKKALENLKSYCEEYQSEINLTVLKIWTQNNKALKIASGETVTTKTLSAKTPTAKPAAKKKTLGASGYKRPAFDLPTTGTYIFKTPKKDYIIESWLFERENDKEDSLQIQDALRGELGSIIIKNNAWRNLANGKTIQARASKGQKGKLTKLK